jgi:RpiR family carbohydrate utilization transcriptional regulator
VLETIAQNFEQLRPAERKVAEFVLADPSGFVHKSITAAAAEAEVSEPTVLRFCRAVGYSGFQSFKIGLAQSLGAGVPYVLKGLAPDDGVPQLVEKVCSHAQKAIADLRAGLNTDVVDQAITSLNRARHIEFYGAGASGVVAKDAQHKFLRLGVPTSAYIDSHQMVISAASLKFDDAVVVFSHTGRSRGVLYAVEVALAQQATVIGVTSAETPLAELCSIPVVVPPNEDTGVYMPMVSRLIHLVVVDILAAGIALRRGPQFVPHLRRVKEKLKGLRVSEAEEKAAAVS